MLAIQALQLMLNLVVQHVASVDDESTNAAAIVCRSSAGPQRDPKWAVRPQDMGNRICLKT